MKKVLFFIILFIPILVYAKDIEIKDITVSDYNGNVEEINDPSIDSNNVNLNLKLNVIDDSITYKVLLKNTSNQEYTLVNSSLDKEYVNYNITYDNDSNVIQSGEEKTVIVNVSYVKKPTNLDNGIFKDDAILKIDLETKDNLFNPNTSDKIILLIVLLFISLLVILLFRNKKKYVCVFLIVLLITPLVVKAVSVYTININANVEIDAKDAMFLPGIDVNNKMKLLAGDDTSLAEYTYNTINTNIVAIKYSEIEPSAENKTDEHIVSTTDSPYPIYMWYEAGTIYWWSEDRTPALNENASFMFKYLINLTDMSGLERYDVSNTREMIYGFASSSTSNAMTYTSLESLANWNTSNLEDINHIFEINRTITSLDGLEKWNVSKVKDMSYVFNYMDKLDNLDALSNWNTFSLENMQGTFVDTNVLSNIDGLNNWNTSKVTNMSRTFKDCSGLTNIDALAGWDTSSVTDMSLMFMGNYNLESIDGLNNWNTSKVENVSSMFRDDISLIKVTGLKWNTSNVTNFAGMFRGATSLEKIDFSSFDMSNSTSFGNFFYDCGVLSEIKTPKAMTDSKTIALPNDFYDEDNNLYTIIDNNTPNEIWIEIKSA